MRNYEIDWYGKRKYDNIMVEWITNEFYFTHMLTVATKEQYEHTAFAQKIADNIYKPMKKELNYKFGGLKFFETKNDMTDTRLMKSMTIAIFC